MTKLEFDENGDSQLFNAYDEASGHRYNFVVRRVRRSTWFAGQVVQEAFESVPYCYFLVDESGQPLTAAVPLDTVLMMTRARLARTAGDFPRPLGAC